MADSIDDRVVRMEFDNSQFERKTAQTIASLERLNRTLQLEGAKRGFSDVQNAANGVKLDKISNDASNISSHFSAMSVIATGALLTVGAAAARAGASIAKSFTLGPIIDGFKEYETNIGSIQTILANTKSQGSTLQEVNAALQELNTYSDKTIYNFSEMTRNIGTFTAAGVDLKTSTASIKGIANLAAISGSNSQQAATAMYQLSQAIASGSVKLMDWNSVVNAGMGGKVFQEALFNTGKALGTIKDVPVGQSFKQWTDAGNSFRESLKSGWITADVLTTTLSGAAGEMTVAQLQAKGFTEAQAKNLVELGKLGIDSATKVRTLTQLLGTVKEAIGSGWANTFQSLLGNFTEATDLFTNLSNSIGGFVGKNAKYRNDLLKGWTMLGGRFLAFAGIKSSLKSIGELFGAIGRAFRLVFPKTSIQGLVGATQSFYKLTEALKPAPETLAYVQSIFHGFFSALKIGITVVKETIKFLAGLVVGLTGIGQGDWLVRFSKIADVFSMLKISLVDNGGIANFFNNLTKFVQKPLPFLERLKDTFSDVFNTLKGFFNTDSANKVQDGFGRIGDRISGLQGILDRLGSILHPILALKDKIFRVLDTIMEPIRNWFHELGDSIAKSMHKGDFSKVLDGLNTALLGGIALLIARFMKKGLNFNTNIDIGRGLFQKISGTFDALTNKLNAMQTEIKANALLKIAAAVGILTASVIALSLIDSKALTKALTAMAVGFGQLMASFALLNKMNINARDAAKFNLIAAAMVILSGAMVVLAVAVKLFATMKADELAKGLAGITGGLTVLTTAAILISKYSDSFILASIGIVAISGALILLGVAMKVFATMSWSEMGKGLAGVVGSLTAIGLAMQLMPASLPLTAAGLVLVGVALNLIAAAMKIFATMSWKDMAKGLAGVAGSLVAIGLAMNFMPLDLPITAAGLILVGVALNIIAGAMKIFGTMKWDEIGRGLAAMGGALLILALATNAMSGAIVGALAIVIVAGSLVVLAGVIKTFAQLKTGDLVHALIGIAAALAVIGLAAYLLLSTGATVAILALGAALLVLGASFALVGAGVYLLGKGLAIIGEGGRDAAKAIGEMLASIGANLSKFGTGLAEGVISFIKSLGEGVPVIIRLFQGIMTQLIASAIKLLPQLTVLIGDLITDILTLIQAKGPDLIATGFFILTTLLQGIADNIGSITTSVAAIIFGFLTALSANIGNIVTAGGNLLVQFLYGVAAQMPGIVVAVANLIATFLNNLAANIGQIITAGGNLIVSFLNGLAGQIPMIVAQVAHLIVTFLNAIAGHVQEIITAGVNLIISFMNGIAQAGPQLANAAGSALTTFLNGMAEAIRTQAPQIRAAGKNIADAVVDGLTAGLADKVAHNRVLNAFGNLVSPGISLVNGLIQKRSPSHVFRDIGHSIGDGLALGIIDKHKYVEDSSGDLARHATTSFKSSLAKVTDGLGGVIDTNPTIKPILDLSQVQSEASKIAGYISNAHGLDTSISLNHAKAISGLVNARNEPALAPPSTPREVSFTQINNSPKALSERDIYKNTRNQLAMAKEKLHIP